MTHELAVYEHENQEAMKEEWELFDRKGFTRYCKILRVSCKGCQEHFYTYNKDIKYCLNCRNSNVGTSLAKRRERLQRRENTICKSCGEAFTPQRAGAVYCSNACRQKAYRGRVTDTPSVSKKHLEQP